jgi:pyrroloquinoline quinone biosynthesis protein B
MYVTVLGSAAGGGFPQWNCTCRNCSHLRSVRTGEGARSQAQLVISCDGLQWLCLNASPDLRSQIISAPFLAPTRGTRATPITGVLLTSADVDSVMGLLHLREFQPLRVYATPSVRRILQEENRIFRVLERANPPVIWQDIFLDQWFVSSSSLSNGKAPLRFHTVALGGEYPDYVSEPLRRLLPPEEAVIGVVLAQANKQVFYAPSLSGRSAHWKDWARSSDVCLLDGTFWTDNELISLGVASKTAREIGHIPLSGSDGLLEQFGPVARGSGRRVLIHINNTNPILDEESPENREVRHAGWEIAYDGMEFEL